MIPFLIFSVIFVSVVFLAIKQNAKLRQAVAQAMLVDPGGSSAPNGLGGEYQGTPYTYRYFQGSKNRQPYLEIAIAHSFHYDFCVIREGWLDAFFKRAGINREIQTKDAAFDRDYYILSQRPEDAARCFASPEIRAAVSAILRTGFTEVKAEKGALTARWNRFRAERLDQAAVTGVLDSLILIKQCAPFVPASRETSWPLWRIRKTVFYAASIGSLAAGFLLYLIGSAVYRLLDPAAFFFETLKYSLPIFAMFVWFAALLLRGRASSHRELAVVFWTSLFGIPFLLLGAMMTANGVLDAQDPMSHDVSILEKYKTRSKNSTTYHIRTSSWREGHEDEHLTVGHGFYNTILPGESKMRLVTKPGALGYEWLDTYAKIEAGRDVSGAPAPEAPDSIDNAYLSMGVARIPFDVHRFKGDPMECFFLRDLFELTDQAMMRRMESMYQLLSGSNAFAAIEGYDGLKSRIGALAAPSRLAHVQGLVLQAMNEQSDFLRQWQTRPGRRQLNREPLVLSAQAKLMQAYGELQAIYPGEDAQIIASFRSYLAALDFI